MSLLIRLVGGVGVEWWKGLRGGCEEGSGWSLAGASGEQEGGFEGGRGRPSDIMVWGI